jgi:hypothetical protein
MYILQRAYIHHRPGNRTGAYGNLIYEESSILNAFALSPHIARTLQPKTKAAVSDDLVIPSSSKYH